jgi:hypothetical protein
MIINEITGKISNHIESKIVDFLQQNCSQFLNIYSKNDLRLYRGMGGPKKLIIKGKPRVHRKPVNTPLIIQRKIDKNLNKCDFTCFSTRRLYRLQSRGSSLNSPFVAISADATELLNKITEAII